MKRVLLSFLLITLQLLWGAWGFFAHRRINYLAVFTLPSGMSRFYKINAGYLRDHAPDADKRRYTDTLEACRHYLDMEAYEDCSDSIPVRWEAAVKKYGPSRLRKDGILPWQICLTYGRLVNAFKRRDSVHILFHSAFLAHYLADAHVPLHTTVNHNGQLSGQEGIHAFWESRIPELFSKAYDFYTGPAVYLADPAAEVWKIIRKTHSQVDSVLLLEKELGASFPAYRKYGYAKRNQEVTRQYAYAYARDYQQKLDHMVERQMRSAVRSIGSFWYSAWIDAGQPSLEHLQAAGHAGRNSLPNREAPL